MIFLNTKFVILLLLLLTTTTTIIIKRMVLLFNISTTIGRRQCSTNSFVVDGFSIIVRHDHHYSHHRTVSSISRMELIYSQKNNRQFLSLLPSNYYTSSSSLSKLYFSSSSSSSSTSSSTFPKKKQQQQQQQQQLNYDSKRQQLPQQQQRKRKPVWLSSSSPSSSSSTIKDINSTTTTSSSSSSNTTNMNTNTNSTSTTTTTDSTVVPLLLGEGLIGINKPINWTSSDVVVYIRKMLERDAIQTRNYIRKPKQRLPLIKCGHGGTLDPLATGVLVLGIGSSGTKLLQNFLSGSKAYIAVGKFGYETTTLDSDPTGTIVKEQTYTHITNDMIESTIQSTQFIGTTVQQIPPLYSALKKNGIPYYQYARNTVNNNAGNTTSNTTSTSTDDITELIKELNIQPRTITITTIQLLSYNKSNGEFTIYVECGGGTYIRSLIRDIAYSLNTVATMIQLQRTKQGPFILSNNSLLVPTIVPNYTISSTSTDTTTIASNMNDTILINDILEQDDWNPINVYSAIERWKASCTQATSTNASASTTTK